MFFPYLLVAFPHFFGFLPQFFFLPQILLVFPNFSLFPNIFFVCFLSPIFFLFFFNFGGCSPPPKKIRFFFPPNFRVFPNFFQFFSKISIFFLQISCSPTVWMGRRKGRSPKLYWKTPRAWKRGSATPKILWSRPWRRRSRDPGGFGICWKSSFSPKLNTGTKGVLENGGRGLGGTPKFGGS